MALTLKKRNKHSSFWEPPGPTSQAGRLPQTLQTLSGEAGRHSGTLPGGRGPGAASVEGNSTASGKIADTCHVQIHDATLQKGIHRGKALKSSVLETTESLPRAGGAEHKPNAKCTRWNTTQQGGGARQSSVFLCHLQGILLREDSKIQSNIQAGCVLYKKSGVRAPIDASLCV